MCKTKLLRLAASVLIVVLAPYATGQTLSELAEQQRIRSQIVERTPDTQEIKSPEIIEKKVIVKRYRLISTYLVDDEWRALVNIQGSLRVIRVDDELLGRIVVSIGTADMRLSACKSKVKCKITTVRIGDGL